MKLKPYPKYKDSGVPWLGEIPVHWELHKGKRLFTKMERDIRLEDGVVTCFRDGIVTLRKNRRTSGFTESLKEIGYQGIRKGDLVIHMMDAFAGAVGVSDSDGKGTPVYSVCQPKLDLNTYFYSYIVREMARSDYILSLAKGIRERSTDFRFDAFASQILPVPPKQEQDKISAYIQGQSFKINRFIRNKRSLIKLLNEQKQVVINQAVTRGISSHASLKSSGIDVVGDVPNHWKMRRVRTVINFITSGSRGWAEYYTENTDDSLFLQSGNLGSNLKLNLDSVQYARPPKGSEGERAVVKKGDILICATGARTGNVAVVREEIPEAYINQHIILIRVIPDEVNFCFLGYYLKSTVGVDQFLMSQYGGTKQGLGFINVKNILFSLPPLLEQKQIVSFCDSVNLKADRIIERLKKQIESIREYRIRLISDVVTGKIDVRDIEIPALPDEDVVEDLEDEELLDAAEAELEAVEDADE